MPGKFAMMPSMEKYAISSDHLVPTTARFLQFRFEIGQVVVLVAKPLSFTESNAVDDARMIQFVRDDRGLLGPRQCFEQSTVGIEARTNKGSCPPFREKLLSCFSSSL